jgi:hypothetical protein
MPSTYNLTHADKAEKIRHTSQESAGSSTSNTPNPSRRSSVQKILDHLRPTEEATAPAGIYSPIIKKGSLFSRSKKEHKSEKETRMSRELRDLLHAAA